MTILGSTLVIKGEMTATSDIEFEGRLEGRIWAEGQSITIAQTGVVLGDVVGRDITVVGAVAGTLIGVDVVDIRRTAEVSGRIVAGRVILADGGLFNGRVEPQQVEAAVTVARHRRQEAAAAASTVTPAGPTASAATAAGAPSTP